MPTELGRKYDQLLAFAAVSVGLEGEHADTLAKGDLAAAMNFYKAAQLWVETILRLNRDKILNRLGDWAYWDRLSGDPATFDLELSKYTKALKTCIKLMWRLPDHAPQRHAARDFELFAIKRENRGLSWQQVADSYNAAHEGEKVTANAVERAIERLTRRAAREIVDAQKFARRTPSVATIPPDEIFDHLPTPEQIFDILAS